MLASAQACSFDYIEESQDDDDETSDADDGADEDAGDNTRDNDDGGGGTNPTHCTGKVVCGPGLVCWNNTCVDAAGDCVRDSDCASEQICIIGYCRDVRP